MSTPTAAEIQTVVRKTVAVLTSRGLSCCLYGSAGCLLYGNSRTPGVSGCTRLSVAKIHLLITLQDVDVVVMTTSFTTEELKAIVATASDFYLFSLGKSGRAEEDRDRYQGRKTLSARCTYQCIRDGALFETPRRGI